MKNVKDNATFGKIFEKNILIYFLKTFFKKGSLQDSCKNLKFT